MTHFPTHKQRTSVFVAFVQLLATSECAMTRMSESFRNAFAPRDHQTGVYCTHMRSVANLSRGISSKTCAEEDIMTFCPTPQSMSCTFSTLSFDIRNLYATVLTGRSVFPQDAWLNVDVVLRTMMSGTAFFTSKQRFGTRCAETSQLGTSQILAVSAVNC